MVITKIIYIYAKNKQRAPITSEKHAYVKYVDVPKQLHAERYFYESNRRMQADVRINLINFTTRNLCSFIFMQSEISIAKMISRNSLI